MSRVKPQRRYWTDAELAILREQYATTPTAEIAHRLGRSVTQVYHQAWRLRLLKSSEYMAEHPGGFQRGHKPNSHSFAPGHCPWNKGTSFVAGGRSAETRFGPGHRPQTWVPVGTEVLDHDGYLKRKVSDDASRGLSRRNWRYVHILLWETHHGPVPPGHAVAFLNGDKTDIRIHNLELVHRRELMRRNTVHNLPAPLAQLVQLKGALQRQINKREGRHEKRHRRPA